MTESHEGRRGWPWWLNRWWVAGPLAFLILVGVRLLIDRDSGLLNAVINGAIYAVVITAVVAWRRRKDGRAVGTDADQVPRLDRRIGKEDIPEDPEERRAMAVLVRRREEQLRSAGRLALPLLGVCVVLMAGLFLVLGAMVPAVVTVAVGALSVPAALWNRRRLFARYARLTRRLEAGPAAHTGLGTVRRPA
ncbi:hypothetical protein OG292_10300 [Streptomyces sp. NBC_01511]|uniref:hypothetical protein n=1 Tax=unclassified Streptomyces TaxID=2593676 RepID=UPI00386C0B8D